MAMILIFAYAWVPGGLDVDSCHYAVVSEEILRTNKWLGFYDPIYGGSFFYHFPLCLWATALFFKLFGVSALTAALFSLLSGLILVAVVFYFGRFLKNYWVGFFAAFSFLLTNHIVRLSRKCRMDVPLSLFVTLAMFSFILAQRRSRKFYLLFGLFTSLAIFTKDVAGLAPLGIAFIYLVIRLKWKELVHPLFISGLLLALGPVFFWIWLDHQTLFAPWFRYNFLHFLTNIPVTEPWYYYIWAITTKYFYLLPFAFYGGYLAIKEGYRSKNYEFYVLLIWILIFPLGFSMGKHKLHYLILPIYPATSLLVGMAWDKIFTEQLKLKIAIGIKYLLIIGSLVMLSFPVSFGNQRFQEIVHLAPTLDRILKQFPTYEFIVYKQDQSSILFYSKELIRVKLVLDEETLSRDLTEQDAPVCFCYILEKDFLTLKPQIRQVCRILLEYKDKLIIINRRDPGIVIEVP